MTEPQRPGRARRGKWTAGVVLSIATLMGAAALAPIAGNASSHREAPLIANDPQADNTDVYAFVSPDAPSTVTMVASWIPMEEPAGGPNFYPFSEEAAYDINIDNDGDGKADVTYRWDFTDHYRNPGTFLYNTGQVTSLTDKDLNFYQTYDLELWTAGHGWKTVVNNAIAAPSNVGKASMPNYAALRNQAIKSWNGSKTFAGQSDDPFFLDLRIFDLLYGADFSEAGDDTLAGFNVNTVALQVPKKALAEGGNASKNPIVGMWSSTYRHKTRVLDDDGADFAGGLVQVSRLGMPLTNEVIIPVGDKDEWNATKPSQDAQFKKYYNDPIVPKVVNAVYGIPVPDSDPKAKGIQRADLIQVFLTGVPGLNQPAGKVTLSDQLRLNMSIAPCQSGNCDKYSNLGVIGGDFAGFPNGRRLADDIVDVALQVMEGELIGSPNDLADGVNSNDVKFESSFPYVALPHSGSDPDPH